MRRHPPRSLDRAGGPQQQLKIELARVAWREVVVAERADDPAFGVEDRNAAVGASDLP